MQQVFGRGSMVLIMTGTTPRRMKKYYPEAGKKAWTIISRHWIQVFREKHFKERHAAEYGYRKRKGEDTTGKAFWRSYTGKKKKQKGHTRPLVWSGRGYAQTLMSRGRLWSGGKGVTVIVPARVYNFKPKGWPYSMRQELITISRPEGQWIEQRYEKAIRVNLRAAKERTVRKF